MPSIKLDRLELKQAIKSFLIISGKNKVLPVLDNMLIDSVNSEGRCSIRATNLSVEIIVNVTCETHDDPFIGLVPVKPLYDFISVCEEESILFSFDTENFSVKVKSDDMSVFFKTEDPGNYPKSQSGIGEASSRGYILNSVVFVKNVKDASRFLSKDELRPAMTFINMCHWNGSMHYVATDAHRLLFRNSREPYCGFDITLKPEAGRIAEILFKEQPIAISTIGNRVLIQGEHAKFYMRTSDDTYPQWTGVLPRDDANEFYVQKKRFLAVTKAATAIGDYTKHISLKIKQHNLLLKTAGVGSNQEYSASVQVFNNNSEGDFTFGFDSRFLLEAASLWNDDLIKFTHSGNSQKCTVINNELLVMPIQLGNYTV